MADAPLVCVLNPWVDLAACTPRERKFFAWIDRTVFLFLGSACNQKCTYCFAPRMQSSFTPLEVVEEHLERVRRHGYRNVIVTGGEPLIHPQLDAVIERVRAAGFDQFGIQSNGLRLAEPDLVDRLVQAGMRYCHLSLDSPDEQTQNTLSGHPRTYEGVLAALRNLARHPQVTLNLKPVITSLNRAQMVDLVRMILRLRDELSIDPTVTLTPMLPIENAYGGLTVRYRAVAPGIREAIDLARSAGLHAFYHHLPPCVMDGRVHESVDWFSRDMTLGEDGHLCDTPTYRKGPRCAACRLEPECQGFSRTYEGLYGDADFAPVGAVEAPLRRPAAADRPRAGACEGGDRVAVVALQDGMQSFKTVQELDGLVPQLKVDPRERTILTGPEPLLHPALPEVIARLARQGLKPWIETLGVALRRSETLDTLLECGLEGIRWLHLPPSSAAYTALLGRPLPGALVPLVGDVLAAAGVPVDHVFVPGDEPLDHLHARVERLRRQAFAGAPGHRLRIGTVPCTEEWSGWLGLREPPRDWHRGLPTALTAAAPVERLGEFRFFGERSR